MNTLNSTNIADETRNIVIERVDQYNRVLTKFLSTSSKIMIACVCTGSTSIIGFTFSSNYIIICLLSLLSAALTLFVGALSGDSGSSPRNIYENPSWAAFYASLQNSRPIKLSPALDQQSDMWKKLISESTTQVDDPEYYKIEDLVIRVISELKSSSTKYHYEQEVEI